MNVWPQEKSGAEGTPTRAFPRQPRKIGDVSDNKTLELIIKEKNKNKIKEYEFTCTRTRQISRFTRRK